jgi:zinc and cadmium transporter
MNVNLAIIAASLLTSLVSFAGALFLFVSKNKINKVVMFLVSLSAGALLGDSFFHLLPEAAKSAGGGQSAWFLVVFGILFFFILEKIIHWRHCHMQPDKNHAHPVGAMNLIGDGFHNLIDGMVIAAAFLVDFKLGVATTIAVISHEIPQELGDFATLIYAGYKAKKALWLNFFSGLASLLGAVIIILIGNRFENILYYIIPFTAGGFIYIAASDLIPELKKESKISETLRQLLGIIIGLLLMVGLKFIFE